MKTKTKHSGRKPGSWKHGLTADALRAFRKNNHVSRARLAKSLGVSQTTINNWEIGLVFPTDRNQDQLQRVMKNPSAVVASAPARQESFSRDGNHGVGLAATGQIVSAYLASAKGKTVTQDDLCNLVRSVRSALL